MRIRTLLPAIVVLAAAAWAVPAHRLGAQAQACLHGADETAEQLARRRLALGFTRHVNTMQARAAAQAGGYQPVGQLGLTQPVPDGFVLGLTSSGSSYAFSVRDTTDPCRFVFFSDQDGVIYAGEVIR